jgi:RNA polymerase sigma-70 factor (ECF subfamily)
MSFEIADVLKRIGKGDETALAVLFAEYGQHVYSMVYRVLQNNALAQEVTQDTFLKIWKNPRAWDASKGQFSSWLLTTARYTAIDRLRYETRRTGKNMPLHDEIMAEVDGDEPLSVDPQRLHAVLGHLPDEQRILIELAYFKGMKHSELANSLNLPLGTVKTRLRLGLQKLRHLLTNESQ